jgi:hypothetical protein
MRQITGRLLTKMVRSALRGKERNDCLHVRRPRPKFQPRFDILEERAMPGDAVGGLLLAGMMGVAATLDPVARAEAVLDLTPAEINYGRAPLLTVVHDDPSSPNWRFHDALDESSAMREHSPPPASSGSGSGAPQTIDYSGDSNTLFSLHSGDRLNLGQDPLSNGSVAGLLNFWDGFAEQSPGQLSSSRPGVPQLSAGDALSSGGMSGASSGGGGSSAGGSGTSAASSMAAASSDAAALFAAVSAAPASSTAPPISAPAPSSHGSIHPVRFAGPRMVASDLPTATLPSGGSSPPASGGSPLAPLAPGSLVASGMPANMVEGAGSASVRLATLTDSDGNSQYSAYSVTINWGDSTPITDGIVSGFSSPFSIYGYHSYAEEGNWTVTVNVTDLDGDTASCTTTVQVADAALSQSSVKSYAAFSNVAFAGPVGTFTDADPGGLSTDYTATINWGDSSSGGGVVSIADPTGSPRFAVSGMHTYAAPGTYNLTTTVTDSAGTTVTLTGNTANVATAPILSSTGGTIFNGGNWIEGITYAVQTLATFTDPDGNTDPRLYSATVNWGDGTSSAASISGGGHPFQVNASHVYAEEGAYGVSFTVNDVDGATLSISDAIIVPDAALTGSGGGQLIAQAQVPFSGNVVSFNDADPNGISTDYTATIDWGDGFSSPGTPSGVSSFVVSGTHTYLKQGTYTVSVRATDIGESTATQGATMVVSAPPPPPRVVPNGFT